MSADLRVADMAFLMEQPAFRRFLFRSIQTAGILAQTAHGADGSDGRDLAYHEGRRSLGFDLLRDAEAGLPAAAQHPLNIMTLLNVLREGAQVSEKEKSGGKQYDRYGEGGEDVDG